MKLEIPSQVKIGAHTFQIVFNTKWVEHAAHRAEVNTKEEKIRLSRGRSNTSLFESLLHEIRHANNDVYGFSEAEEEVCARTAALTLSLLSLGIEPDFSQIPEEGETED